MCGLVGIAGNLEHKDEATMKRLLILDFFRGTDATGLAAVRSANNEVLVSKAAVNPIDLFQFKGFDRTLTAVSSKVFLGHNRAATIGKATSNVNAHPFAEEFVVGAHNGTLDRPSWTRLEEAIGYETNVDSQALIAAIDKLGVEDAISLCEEGRASTTGAWALTWYDSRDDTINFLRNPHRPLWRACSKDGKKLFWASEWAMIRAATDLGNGYEYQYDDKGHSFFMFGDNIHYKATVSDLTAGGFTAHDFDKKAVKGREPPPVYSYSYNNNAGFHANKEANSGGKPPFTMGQANKDWSGTTSTMTKATGGSRFASKVVDLFSKPDDQFAGFITKEEYDSWGIDSCGWCGGPVNYHDTGITIYEQLHQALCPNCSHNEKTSRVYTGPIRFMSYLKDVG